MYSSVTVVLLIHLFLSASAVMALPASPVSVTFLNLLLSHSELKERVSLLSARLEKIEDNHTKEVLSLKLHHLNLEEKNDQLQLVVNKLKDRPPVRPFRPVPKFFSGNLVSHSSSSGSNQPWESLPVRPTDRPPCPFRIVWGTPSTCSFAEVKHALTPLLPPD